MTVGLTTSVVYYRLFDPNGSLAKLVLQRNTFVPAKDNRIGRIDIANRIGVNTVAGIAEVIAKHENCGDTYLSSNVEVWEDINQTKFLPGSSPRPQGVNAVGTNQNKPLIIKFSMSVDKERKAKKSGTFQCFCLLVHLMLMTSPGSPGRSEEITERRKPLWILRGCSALV